MLNACGQRTIACGNIGKPLCEVAREQSRFDVLTVEVSSFQLETIRTFRPAISVWLNFAPDHLDRYRSVAEYRAAKLRIFDNQTADDVAIVNASERLPKIAARTLLSAPTSNGRIFVLASGAIVYQDEAGPASGGDQAARLAQHRESDGRRWRSVWRAGLTFAQMVPPLCAYRAAAASLRIRPRSRRRRLHQRFEGDQSRRGGESAARPNQTGHSDRRRQGQRIHLRSLRAARCRESRARSILIGEMAQTNLP